MVSLYDALMLMIHFSALTVSVILVILSSKKK